MIPLQKDDSIPAVPEFSMPPSSGSTPAVPPNNSSTGPQSGTGAGFKVVFKGSLGASDSETKTTIASPLPHPPSPSAPASSNFSSHSVSPDPDSMLHNPTMTSSSANPAASGENKRSLPSANASIATEPPPDDTSSAPTKKEKKNKGSKGKGKKRTSTKGTKRKSKDALLDPPEPSTGTSSMAGIAIVGGGGEGVARRGRDSSATSTSLLPMNRVCHHHKSVTKDQSNMTCSNQPECRTIWCRGCIEKYYISSTPTHLFVEGSTFICPVCTGECRCAPCRRKRKEGSTRSQSVSVAPTSTYGDYQSPGGGGIVVKMEEEEENDRREHQRRQVAASGSSIVQESKPFVAEPVSDSAIDPSLHPPASRPNPDPPNPIAGSQPVMPLEASTSSALDSPPLASATSEPSAFAPPPAASVSTPTPLSTGILKIRVKPPKRPRTEKGHFVPQGPHYGYEGAGQDGGAFVQQEEEEGGFGSTSVAVASAPISRKSNRGGARKGAGRRGSNLTSGGGSTIATGGGGGGGGSRSRSATAASNHHDDGGGSFFGRPPSLAGLSAAGGGVGIGRGVRPKRTKKVSSQYDDFSVEGVPNFVDGVNMDASSENGGVGIASGSGAGGTGRETRSGGGRWGGYRRGAGGRRKTTDSAADLSNAPPHPTLGLMNSNPAASMIGRDGKPRRRPRLSGLSSASSCSELSSAGGLDDDDFEASYWATKQEFDERESDQRVRHWLLVPPTEPQPVLAGLERNLSEGGGEEVGFSPTSATSVEAGRKKKEKVKWIEGPERRRRRALAVQKMREEEDAKLEGLSKDVVKEDEEMQSEVKKILKRSLSFDASENIDKAKDLFNHCSPIKPFGDGPRPSSSPPARKLSLPVRPASAPNLSSPAVGGAVSPATVGTQPVHSDQPPPYEAHFPPSINAPLPIPASQPPAIIVSPATTACDSPPILIAATSTSPNPTPSASSAPSSFSSFEDLELDLAARSLHDKRLGLRLLDAFRTITGIGLPPSAPSSAGTVSSSSSIPPRPSTIAASPTKAEEGDAFSLLISQEHAEYEALRREERQRVLSSALDPQKVFRAEAKGNVSLLDGMEIDGNTYSSDDVEAEIKDGAGVESLYDLETFLVTAGGDEDSTASSWNPSMSSTTTTSTSGTPQPVDGLFQPNPSISAVPADRQTVPRQIPETPSKLVLSASHLSATVSSDPSHPWSSSMGGAATPTRGLVMELDFDFDHVGQTWPHQHENEIY